MPESPLHLIRAKAEFLPKAQVGALPRGLRGIYVLYRRRKGRPPSFDVLYVGMARAGRGRGLKRRLLSHRNSPKKKDLWSHFSVFEVWDNVRDEEVEELEGVFRHIYRYDTQANSLNVLRSYKKLQRVLKINLGIPPRQS